ncbi:MAG: mechanosensitive ion channel protein MscS [Flavobacteriales bacterium]|nr:MAG: mechanosensitive ion channel protein MscS [Flavobacteriales bacterium]
MSEKQTLEHLLQDWQHAIIAYLPKIFMAVIVLIIFYLIAVVIKKLSLKVYSKFFKSNPHFATVITVAIYLFFILSGVFLALEVLGLESVLTKVLASAGIVGIIAGFAFKDIASNAFAGFLVHTQHPFKPGDWVEIDGTYGTVLNMSWITTSIKTISGQEVFVPNQLIYSGTFTNYSSFGKRRVIFKSGVSYGDDLDLVKRVALEEVDQMDIVLKAEGVDFYFKEIGSSSYNFEVRFWIDFTHQKDYLLAMDEIITRIKKRFEKEDISLAYAVTTLDFGVKGGVNIFDKPVVTKSE